MLSPDQIAARRYRLGGSDMACLMTARPGNQEDARKIHRLWQEKRGEIEPENLDHVWPVQRGSATEALNIRWYGMKNSTQLTRIGEVVPHPKYPWAGVTLDAWIEELSCPFEAKDCGNRYPIDPVLIERYQPQCQWLMQCTSATQCALSIIFGGDEPIVTFIPADTAYQMEMLRRGSQFWRHVIAGTEPVVLEPVAPPADRTRVVNMMETPAANQWGSSAFTWLEDKPAAERCDDAAKILKSLVPEDATKCFGAGIQIVVGRDGKKKYLREGTT